MFELINANDLITPEHLPIKNLLESSLMSNCFKWVLENLSDGNGCGLDYSGGFTFWSDLDDYDKTFYEEEFTGVEVDYRDSQVVIDYETIYKYFQIAVSNYLKTSPNEKEEFYQLLSKMKEVLGL
ncbi:ribonuclease toxin immunity protein CdiI [Bacillus sp. DX1.1]|uniref:ribonuclease toxin immunity protein CdiI n=1 Tax=unclassified Bacillus (in: firmicutes) TaxID=185979 RepID=UPI0025711233|nr:MULTISPECIES: ribonuclease toxin immunity protein CdiI [unclassified Bacillus (in: firmicutes)]MDM5154734.1 ribonuclease toxin immunity protein CdiI [Bacillus sp. DX1.1]WJE83617.1 ribonuclease toxin immunity protein CdiI [Bacillus sp. DX3.1]